MKIKTIFATMFALAAVLSSCIKEDGRDGDPNSNEPKTVVLSIADGASSRAMGAPDGYVGNVKFTSGTVYFADENGAITKTLSVGVDKDIDLTTAGIKTINNVPAQSSDVYIIGNIEGLPLNGDISQIVDYAVAVETQLGVDKDVTAIALYGDAKLTKASSTSYVADITVNPIGGRVEIKEFLAEIDDITDYKVDGIFINHYYKNIKLSGVVTGTAGDLVINETETTPPTIYTGDSQVYDATNAGYVYDFNAAGLGTYSAKSYSQVSGIWAYNLLAPKSVSTFPHIVIRFTGITGVQGVEPTHYKYITVGGFRDSVTGDPIQSFDAGSIYTIDTFKFTENDLDVLPEMETITATVTVTLASWSRVPVEPIH